jgi:hypothetical protein
MTKLTEQQAGVLTDARWNEMRDAVLNERGSLAEAGLDSDQVNAVLGVIDDYMPAQSPPATAPAPQSTDGDAVEMMMSAFLKVLRGEFLKHVLARLSAKEGK